MSEVDTSTLSPQALADAASDAMWQRDRAAHALGMERLSVAPGHATLRMVVRPDMVNGHQTCHGGMIFRWLIPPLLTHATATT